MASISTLGIPVRSVNWVRVFPTWDSEGKDCLVAIMGQQAAGFTVVKIDPNHGKSVQVTASNSMANFPTSAIRSHDGCIYIGAAYAGTLYRYDPIRETLNELGGINIPDDTFPCNMDEDKNKLIWIGCYGSASLTSYNPETNKFVHHGKMDDIDMYCYPRVGDQGTIACLINATCPHVVVYHPQSKIRKKVGPIVAKKDCGSVLLYRAADQQLYIRSTQGNYRLCGFDREPIKNLPEEAPPLAMSDGSIADFLDRDIQQFRVIGITSPISGKIREIPLSYESAGSEIYLLHKGPDKKLYGSSILPLHLFRFDSQKGAMEDLGICSTAAGEAYSMANMDNQLYICTYPGAMLSVYDPLMDYQFGFEKGNNPRQLGRMDKISYRPRSMIAGPLGRIWTASIPDYGLWGGPLSWYDPVREEFGTYPDIAGKASCWSLAWLVDEELIAVGTTINGGTGTRPQVDEATLFLWDYTQEEKIWESNFPIPVTEINSLILGPDKRLYGTAVGKSGSFLFIYDPRKLNFIEILSLPVGRALDLSLQIDSDRYVYGFTSDCCFRFNLVTNSIERIYQENGAFEKPGPIDNGELYFSKKHELKKLVI